MFAKLRFFKNSGIGLYTLVALFSIKFIAGFFYSYYFSLPSQIENADTWNYFIESKSETDWLLHNPKAFFADLFTNHYNQTGNLFSCTNSFWNDLKATFFIKLLAVLNIFSNKNYYINLLFFNAAFMFGGVALFRLFNEKFIINKWILIAAIFLTPSFLFWCSGIHKDGIVFSATALSIYFFTKVLQKEQRLKYLTYIAICFATIFLLRNYYLLAILPAFFTWFLVNQFRFNVKIAFAASISVCLLFFIFSGSFSFTKGISESLVSKHNEFLTLTGNTKFQTPSLNTTASSIIAYFPFAMQSSLLRPFPNKIISIGEFFVTIENYLFILLSIVSIVFIFIKKREMLDNPIMLTCVTISFFLLLFIGYTVCFDAAIIRYRSVSFPFLIVPCVIIIFGKAKNSIINKI